MKLSIISPWYKSPESIEPLYEKSLSAVSQMTDFDEVEFVFVEDGGKDTTWQGLKQLAERDSRVKAVRLSRNFGQHHAATACMDLCTGDWVVLMDCDLQDRPEEIPALWAKAKEGYDMVCARRCERQDTWWKRTTSRLFYKIFNLISGMDYDGTIANFRIMSRKVVDACNDMREASRSIDTQLQWLGFKVGTVDVAHGERFAGQSSYTFAKLCKLAMDMIVAYSNRPLELAIKLGGMISLLSFLMAIWVVIQKLFFDVSILGWAGLMVSIWFVGGIVIGILGIIGLYLGKIYDEVKQRPIYVIAESVNLH